MCVWGTLAPGTGNPGTQPPTEVKPEPANGNPEPRLGTQPPRIQNPEPRSGNPGARPPIEIGCDFSPNL
eukprot:1600105-Pyramimonas_sp.AAC.1